MKQKIILFALSLIPFLNYFQKEGLIGADSYYYLNHVCNQGVLNSNDLLFDFFIQFMPCNILLIKIILFFSFFLILLIVQKIGDLFYPKEGFFIALIFGFTTFFITEFWKFENDFIGILLAFSSLYFLFKHFKQNKKIFSFELFISAGLLIISGLFWKGVIYWVPIYPLFAIIFLPSLLAIIFFKDTFFWFLNANQKIYEHQTGIGLLSMGLPILLIIGFFKTEARINIAFIITLIPALFVLKLFFLPLLFLTLIAWKTIRIIFQKKQSLKNFKTTLIIFSILMSFFFASLIPEQFPTQKDINLVKETVKLNQNINNDFTVGYLIEYLGGKPKCKGFLCEYPKENYVIQPKIKPLNCHKKIESTNYILYYC